MSALRWISSSVLVFLALAAPSSVLAQATGGTVVVGTPVGIDIGPLPVVAVAKGFDGAEGIKMDLKPFASGAAMVEALAAGLVHVGSAGDVPFLSLVAGGVKVKLIAQNDISSKLYELYARQDLNLRRPEQLQGRSVGFVFGSTSSMFMARLIELYRLDGKAIRQVNLQPGDIVQAYQRGDIDAFIGWPPSTWQAAKERPSVLLHNGEESFFAERAGPAKLWGAHTVTFAREDFLRQNPQGAAAFIRALRRSLAYINDPRHRAELVELYVTRTKMDKEIVERGFEQKHFTWQLHIDEELIRNLEYTADFFSKAGRFKVRPDVKSAVEVGPLRTAAPDLVRWAP